ncbi:uncharacterized protein LOC143290799 [Babylonia areolata]|uniref:uncharacterized protein LOC143290799 n=1 Tax=Babylonia areolata TaxID=304850 RepID=UPI003FD37DF6
MKHIVAIFLLVVCLALGGETKAKTVQCTKDKGGDNCQCDDPFYFRIEGEEKCTSDCSKLAETYTRYDKSMIEQGTAFDKELLGDVNDDIDECKEECNRDVTCVAIAHKQNQNTQLAKCFFYKKIATVNEEKFREGDKGRWTYYHRNCLKGEE